MNEIINKVAESSLITINLEALIHPGERVVFDIKDQLFMGLILKEKDFRSFIKENDWSVYTGKNVAMINSADAIVPTWAYMLVASKLQMYANRYIFGNLGNLEQALIQEAIANINPDEYMNAKIVVKGCSSITVPDFAYVEIMHKLLPVASSIMYGEPCSTVPIYKKLKF
ncbi:DUF2480 family protein [Adhaeribacter pallidiroseus]|uniref:DUF2480 family protein n=1 Tax=Adhaeribacter pallidiroseus TaxID=2072847 RepID=A0A369QD70_9BACT|nr:DUF2480 family protein [Adhaeribacter pallidiroseus]RDC62863.1 hypothetical protein AHMF7616_01457 [Adhaeribacter pallidiroseus]